MNRDDKNPASILDEAVFKIGDEDQLHKLRADFAGDEAEAPDASRFPERWAEFLKDCHIKIGTLLKSDNVSFLIGAGASKHVGGVLLGSLPLDVERQILDEGSPKKSVTEWLKLFYLALHRLCADKGSVPTVENEILTRRTSLQNANRIKEIAVNFEALLSLLHRWRSALPEKGGTLRIEGEPAIEATSQQLDHCLKCATKALARRCILPQDNVSNGLDTHQQFLKKVLTRPLNLKRVNLFTLNYDTLIEQAADAEGIVLLDGFVGTIRRVFRPESYDQDLYFPAETTEGRVHRLDRVIHLYKLHGSINWVAQTLGWDNPYGVSIENNFEQNAATALIYPTPAKYGETLGMPYSELFRRFAGAVTRPQSTLFVVGYAFGDEHVNAIIHQALAIPSFTLVIVDPFAPEADEHSDKFLAKLRARHDRRVWVISGESLGFFSTFVDHVLPDLRDEEILGQVMKTYRSLGPQIASSSHGVESDGK